MRQALLVATLSFPFVTPPAMGWEGLVSAEYAKTFAPSDPVINFGLSLSLRLNKTFGLFLSQDVEKNMVVDSSKDELVAADTRFGVKIYPTSLVDNVSWLLTLSATLPTSKDSRHDQIHSKPEIKLGAAYQPWSWLTISGSAIGRYYIEKFETAPTHAGEGGEVLPDYRLGLGQGTAVNLGGFNFGYDYGYRETTYHTVKQTVANNAYLNEKAAQGYSVSLYLSRELWTGASLSGSFSQGSALVHEGWEDYVLFDKEESSWGVGFSQSF